MSHAFYRWLDLLPLFQPTPLTLVSNSPKHTWSAAQDPFYIYLIEPHAETVHTHTHTHTHTHAHTHFNPLHSHWTLILQTTWSAAQDP
jgi:hypothetical protein